MISLSDVEKRELKIFFEINRGWIKNNSLLDEKNLITFNDMYGEYLDEKGLNYSRNLQMFLIALKEETMKAKVNRGSVRLNSFDIRNIPLSVTLSNNQTVNMWMSASNIELEINNQQQTEEFDYEKYEKIIEEQRKKVLESREKQKTK